MNILRLLSNCVLIVITIVVFAVSFSGSMAQEAQKTGEITLIENGLSGVTIIYTPEVKQIKQTIRNITYTSFEAANTIFEALPGEPAIPQRQVIIAIPEHAQVNVEVIENDFQVHSSIVALAAPGPAALAASVEENRWFPGEPISNIDTGYIRTQHVVAVTLNPVHYNPVLNEARISTRMVVNVSFNFPENTQVESLQPARPVSTAQRVDPYFENIYKNVIVNYESGKSWRKSVKPGPAKRSAVLPAGPLYTFNVSDEGIYRISYQDLVNNNIVPESIDPLTIKIFNNGGMALPENPNQPRPEGLLENAVRVVGEEDGSLDPGDYILFYAFGTNGWKWNSNRSELRHYQSVYSKTNMYWFTFGGERGKRMNNVPYSPTGVSPVETAKALQYLEEERHKLYLSGNNWYMDVLLSGDSNEYTFQLPGYSIGSQLKARALITSVASVNHRFSLSVDNNSPTVVSYNGATTRAVQNTTVVDDGNNVTIRAANTSPGSNSEILVDWYEVEYTRDLTADDGSIRYFTSGLAKDSPIRIKGFPNDQFDIYNITDFQNVYRLDFSYTINDSSAVYSDNAEGDERHYLAVAATNYITVDFIRSRSVTDLRAAATPVDMVIITPEEFTNAVQPLRDLRQTRDNLLTKIVTVSDIYDNFSAGLQDPVAVRDFVKFAYENWTDGSREPLRYVLLFGDGHFDYLGVLPSSAPMRVPSFQVNSLFEMTTRTIDDFYGYVSGDDNFLDVAIGRLPVQTVEMAHNVVAKIIKYQSQPDYGPWRNRIGFSADDEKTPNSSFERLHTDQSESIARASYIPSYLDQRKIYLMEYPEVRDVTSSSPRKPEAEDDMVALINEGVYILSYVGHGNERVLAHEWLLNREIDMPRIDNEDRQFFFYLSSCTFGRWDFPAEDSMGELLVTRPDRGAIGLVSAARDVFAGPNFALMNAYYRNFFPKDPDIRKTTPLGVALMQAKLATRSINSEKYHLLGDPSMSLDLPGGIVRINSIQPDSLKALATVKIEGTIESEELFEGSLFLSVFDTEKDGEHTMINGSTVGYKLPGSPIFKGATQIDAGSGNQFSMGFVVPKDITYGGKNGRISLYLWNNSSDGAIAVSGLPVGGTQLGVPDTKGPEIEVEFDGRRFISGDIVGSSPVLQLKLTDPHGINITGEIGHKIELVFDDDPSTVDLSRFFVYDNGSYTSGSTRYKIVDLSPGQHTMSVRAWDNFNNSSTFKGILDVVTEDDLVVREVFNYPNPFSDNTQFTSQISSPADIEIKIYTIRGRLIRTLRFYHDGSSSFFSSPVWDGRDEDGDKIANGTYMYKFIVKSDTGGVLKQVEIIGKLVVMR